MIKGRPRAPLGKDQVGCSPKNRKDNCDVTIRLLEAQMAELAQVLMANNLIKPTLEDGEGSSVLCPSDKKTHLEATRRENKSIPPIMWYTEPNSIQRVSSPDPQRQAKPRIWGFACKVACLSNIGLKNIGIER